MTPERLAEIAAHETDPDLCADLQLAQQDRRELLAYFEKLRGWHKLLLSKDCTRHQGSPIYVQPLPEGALVFYDNNDSVIDIVTGSADEE